MAEETLHWYRGNTHTHTSAPPASDVITDPAAVVAWFRGHGYDFVVITDHEYLTDVEPLNAAIDSPDFLVLPGQEITQMVRDPTHHLGVRHAHMNGIGTTRAVLPLGYPDLPEPLASEWRATPPLGGPELFARRPDIAELFADYPSDRFGFAETYVRNTAEIRDAGGLPQINHPNLHWSVRKSDLDGVEGPVLMEIANAFWAAGNQGGSDGDNSSPSTEELWDELLSDGKVIWATGGDDSHDYAAFDDPDAPTPGKAWIVVRAATLDRTAILDALTAGRFYASTGVELVDYAHGDGTISISIAQHNGWGSATFPGLTRFRTRFIGKHGEVLADVPGENPSYRFRGDELYVRATITDSDGRRAWTQPVFS